MDRIKVQEQTLNRLLDWIKSADSRISFNISMSTAMLGVLAILIQHQDKFSCPVIIISILTALLLILSILFSTIATFPRTNGPDGSVIYFGGISKNSLEKYADAIGSITEQKYLNDLISQCHRNAKIATRKYFWIKLSISFLIGATLPWLFSIFILYN